MKSYRYSIFGILMVASMVLVTTEADAQRGRSRHGGYQRGYYRPHYPVRSYAYNRPFISLNFGGSPYRYQHGSFYRPYGSTFRVSVPPIGIRIRTLPVGYHRMYVGPDPYYYYNGVYYRSYQDNEYEVVAPPLGAKVRSLPTGAKVVVIDGRKYYELEGTYFEERINENDEVEYVVAGTDGVLDTEGELDEVPAGPQVGDRFESLPPDAKAVVIQGEKFYTTGSGLYYKEVFEGNKVFYEVVGQ